MTNNQMIFTLKLDTWFFSKETYVKYFQSDRNLLDILVIWSFYYHKQIKYKVHSFRFID